MAFQHGIENAVACCGTALGENHIKLLKRFCDSVVLLLDGDEAGQRRTAEILELFISEQMDLRILTLPDGLDPCDYLRRHGGESLQSLLGSAVDALEHKIRTVCRGFDPLLDTHRATAALEDILQSMARVSKPSLATNEASRLRQDQIIARLSRQFGIGQQEIRQRLDGIRANAAKRQQFRNRLNTRAPDTPTAEVGTTEDAAPKLRYVDLRPVECELFEILVLHPELAPMAIERFPVDGIQSETGKHVFALYVQLELDAHQLDFSSVMSATEDPSMQSVLVSIEEHATRKAPKATMTAEERLHSLCERWAGQDDAVYRRSQIRALEQSGLDDQTELNLLKSVLHQAKIRHGIVPAEE
jgi:DNA primase